MHTGGTELEMTAKIVQPNSARRGTELGPHATSG
jgi:hypothetical protein